MILSEVKWQNVLVYLDDLIILSADAESHLSHFDTVLTLLRKHGNTLKAQKCHLFSNEVEYFGHVVRPGRLSVNEKSLKAIKKAIFPQTRTQLGSFLGMCNVKDVLRAEQSCPLAAHPGGKRMYQTLRDQYHWPSLAMDVLGWVAACPTCAKNRLMGTQSEAFMRLFPATQPFAALAIDLLGPLPRTSKEYEYILVICDRFTKVTRAVPLRDITALDGLSAFLDTWVASYGIPDLVLSDNRPQFAAVLWQGVLKTMGIDTNYATSYHPQTNGQVERFNKTLIKQLRHYVSDHVVTLSRYLSLVVTAYNSQVHSSTGQIPVYNPAAGHGEFPPAPRLPDPRSTGYHGKGAGPIQTSLRQARADSPRSPSGWRLGIREVPREPRG